jgi:cell division protein FtsN
LSKGAAPDAVQRNEYEKSYKFSIKNMFAVSVVVLAVVGSDIAAYFYAIKEPQMAKETVPMPETVLPSPQNQLAAPPEINVQSQIQPSDTTMQLQDKTTPAATVVSPPVAVVTKEQIPDQKPTEQIPPKADESAKMAATVNTGFYTVNVGSFKFKKSVDGVMKKLSKKGYAPAVETVTLNDKNTWYRVTVSQFKTREEAARFARELGEKMKLETMVVKRK